MNKFLIICFSCIFIGCAIQPITKLESRMSFPEQEYQNLQKSGTAIVTGQAFLKTRGGDVKFAAGNRLILNPVTSYSNEWYEKYYVQGKNIGQADPRCENYTIKTIADGTGRFIFKNVPAGEYYLTTTITWEAATGYNGALQKQGGVVTKRISVKEGDELEVILTR